MAPITVYDATADTWQPKIAPDINPVPSDSYECYNTPSGLVAVNAASKENAGGLVSISYPLPSGAQFFGLDVDWNETAEDLPRKARNEMDLKVTLFSGASAAIPNQANGSLQWNATRKTWQLDPNGTGWVDSGYTEPPVVGKNSMALRLWSDGKHWSVTGLQLNGGPAFVPGAAFQNLPMITTNWSAGLHPQLQTEAQGTPWFLRSIYTCVLVMASATPISMEI